MPCDGDTDAAGAGDVVAPDAELLTRGERESEINLELDREAECEDDGESDGDVEDEGEVVTCNWRAPTAAGETDGEIDGDLDVEFDDDTVSEGEDGTRPTAKLHGDMSFCDCVVLSGGVQTTKESGARASGSVSEGTLSILVAPRIAAALKQLTVMFTADV